MVASSGDSPLATPAFPKSLWNGAARLRFQSHICHPIIGGENTQQVGIVSLLILGISQALHSTPGCLNQQQTSGAPKNAKPGSNTKQWLGPGIPGFIPGMLGMIIPFLPEWDALRDPSWPLGDVAIQIFGALEFLHGGENPGIEQGHHGF